MNEQFHERAEESALVIDIINYAKNLGVELSIDTVKVPEGRMRLIKEEVSNARSST